jgi:hypothetical protein
VAEEHRVIQRLVAVVDERARRLVAGLLALQHGRGGVTLLARITGLSRTTVQRGQRELQQPEPVDPGRVRRPGGGRRPVEKNVRTS